MFDFWPASTGDIFRGSCPQFVSTVVQGRYASKEINLRMLTCNTQRSQLTLFELGETDPAFVYHSFEQ